MKRASLSTIIALLLSMVLIAVSGAVGSAQGATYTESTELVMGFGVILIGVSALLIAVGALVVFVKLAKILDKLEERFKGGSPQSESNKSASREESRETAGGDQEA